MLRAHAEASGWPRLGADAEAEPPPTPELCADLIVSVLAAIEPPQTFPVYERRPQDACRAAARWCALNKAHRDACRDDTANWAWRTLADRLREETNNVYWVDWLSWRMDHNPDNFA